MMDNQYTIWKTRWENAHGPDNGGWCIGPNLWEFISRRINCASRTIEFGAGLSTWLFNYVGCDHTALEHSPVHWEKVTAWPGFRTAGCMTVPLLRRLISDPGRDPWYDWRPEPGDTYDLILIDGPPGDIGRNGIMNHIETMINADRGGVIIVDDVNREADQQMAGQIGLAFQTPVKYHAGGDGSQFGVITIGKG